LAGHSLVRGRRGGRHSTADLVVRSIDGGHHHLVSGGSSGRRIFGRLTDCVAYDIRDVPESLTGVRNSLQHKISRRKIKDVIFDRIDCIEI